MLIQGSVQLHELSQLYERGVRKRTWGQWLWNFWSLKRMACFAWLSFRRCFNVRADFSGLVSMLCTSTGLMSIAVPGLPPSNRGNPKGTEKVENEENIAVIELKVIESKIRSDASRYLNIRTCPKSFHFAKCETYKLYDRCWH